MPTVPIMTTLLAEINTILNGLPNKGDVFDHPVTKLSNYPAIVFYPTNGENSFSNVAENFKIYNFSMFAIVATQQITVDKAWTEVLANLYDEIMEAFDSGWSLSNINGNRVWIKINATEWGMSEEQKGQEAWVEFNIEVKLSTDN